MRNTCPVCNRGFLVPGPHGGRECTACGVQARTEPRIRSTYLRRILRERRVSIARTVRAYGRPRLTRLGFWLAVAVTIAVGIAFLRGMRAPLPPHARCGTEFCEHADW